MARGSELEQMNQIFVQFDNKEEESLGYLEYTSQMQIALIIYQNYKNYWISYLKYSPRSFLPAPTAIGKEKADQVKKYLEENFFSDNTEIYSIYYELMEVPSGTRRRQIPYWVLLLSPTQVIQLKFYPIHQL